MYSVKGSRSSGKMKACLLDLYEGFSGILTKSPSHVIRTNIQIQAIEHFITGILAIHNQLRILIDTLVIERSGEAMVQIHQISEGLRDTLVNDPEMLNSPNLAEMIVEDQKTTQNG
jgi:hypothetical protein